MFYLIDSNKNGKIIGNVYISKVLEGPVRRWKDRGDEFVLKEDRDSGHGIVYNSKPAVWKRKNNITTFFNAPSSPDLAPIENS